MTGNMIAIAMISTITLAAIGMRIAGGEPWRGGVMAIAFIIGSVAASVFAQSLVVALVAGAVVASIAAGAMRVPRKQSANALLGCVIGHLVPLALM